MQILKKRYLTPISTSQKIKAKVDVFIRWLQRIPTSLKFDTLNGDEIAIVVEALDKLEQEIHIIRASLPGANSAPSPRASAEPRNHSAEWTIEHINQIMAPDRPSDAELARRIGRSISAIRSMRSKMNT
ncbi:MAG: hypothetical protein COU90_02475 [Candidatus Ryanbacteria bacterium CG10_big_fil_rev_8_21_14_0_10_43_42]|uniref:Uncharacterized protein n=1 Tax=Candidatus Ryanbacteria bacterium CG10_big_fil_rev_8_21_14_0_10_43_42 TaxID=1974864 RepID=A0A2M8KWL8_9BACT|nr:MAG: hypothetical protein COU90_02475 [Candidatus Ryanbacteria bacterium CG10_big_fil_rev_8_21_14_0_10_43_42]